MMKSSLLEEAGSPSAGMAAITFFSIAIAFLSIILSFLFSIAVVLFSTINHSKFFFLYSLALMKSFFPKTKTNLFL